MRSIIQRWAAHGLLLFVCAACAADSSSTSVEGSSPQSVDSVVSSESTSDALGSDVPQSSDVVTQRPSGACVDSSEATPLEAIESVAMTRIYAEGGFTVDAAIYPHPDYEGNPWSQWGQGIVAPTGLFYSAIGDHFGRDGNSYLYEFNPGTNELVLVADVLGSTEHEAGAWGYGKVHAQMTLGPCDEIFFATYWGSRRDLIYSSGYDGDLLFHIDPYDRTLTAHGVVVEERGLPTMASSPSHGLLYAIAVEPDSDQGTFVAIDAYTSEVIFSAPAGVDFRAIGVDADGVAYFSSDWGEVSVYDPAVNMIVEVTEAPGSYLRATELVDGTLVGVMHEPDNFFTVQDRTLVELNSAEEYTTSIAVVGDEIFYLPYAHGSAYETGARLLAVNLEDGEERVVIALADLVEAGLGVTVGGSYNLALDQDANRLYVGVNVDTGDGSGFGEVALLVIGLP